MAKKNYDIEKLFKALADRTRLRLIGLLGDSEVCVCFLVEILNTGHFAWSDLCAGSLFGVRDCDPGTLTQDEAHALVLRYAIPFLARYLAGEARFAKLLTAATAPPGVVLTANTR